MFVLDKSPEIRSNSNFQDSKFIIPNNLSLYNQTEIMEGVERLYYGLGLLAYAVAKADGKIDPEERRKLHEIVEKESSSYHHDLNISEIIFHILKKYDNDSQDDLYERAIGEFRTAKAFIEDDMRSDFPALLEKIARAFHPITDEENRIIQKFRKDLESI